MSYSDQQSLTAWLDRLKQRDETAVQRIWERCFEPMVRRARGQLRASVRRAEDEEDVALSAFDSFCRAAAEGRFPKLDDRDDLWQILFLLTDRKASDLQRKHRAAKRGGGEVRGDSVFIDPAFDDAAGLDGFEGPAQSPAYLAELTEEFQLLLKELGDAGLQQLALLKMEGFENEEIAQRLDLSLRTVERKLGLIRRIWLETRPARGGA